MNQLTTASRSNWIGVDIGGTKTAAVLASAPPAILDRIEFPTLPANGPEAAIRQIFAGIESLLDRCHLQPADVAAIGISCGDPLSRSAGVIQAPPNLPTWIDVPIKAILEDRFGVPAMLENDANAGAMAEHRYGAGVGTRNMAFLTVGTGLGAGLILEGRLFHGATDSAGEIGHVRLTRRGPIGYGKIGSVEGWASGGGMAQVASKMVRAAKTRQEKNRAAKHGPPSPLLALLDDGGSATISAKDVAAAALAGDALARRILRASALKLGEAMAILVDVVNPECIVAGGLALRLGDLLLEPARSVVRRESLARPAAACRIVPAALGERIGDVAALCIAQGFC